MTISLWLPHHHPAEPSKAKKREKKHQQSESSLNNHKPLYHPYSSSLTCSSHLIARATNGTNILYIRLTIIGIWTNYKSNSFPYAQKYNGQHKYENNNDMILGRPCTKRPRFNCTWMKEQIQTTETNTKRLDNPFEHLQNHLFLPNNISTTNPKANMFNDNVGNHCGEPFGA